MIQSRCRLLLPLIACVLVATVAPALADDAPVPSRTLRVTVEPGLGPATPAAEMEIYDEAHLDRLEKHWEKLMRKGMNPRTWKTLPDAPGVNVEDIRPRNAPTTDLARGASNIVLEVNTQPSDAAGAGFRSTVQEPSTAAGGDVVFYTGNWYAARSDDGGNTFTFVNPFAGPFADPANEGFCCDQVSVYDEDSNTLFWLQQYIPDPGPNGTQRVNVDQNNDGTWDCFYDLTPQDAGFPNNNWADYPDIALSDDHLFVSSNVFATAGGFSGAFAGRIPLAEASTCAPANIDYHTEAGNGSFRFTRGATDTMYFADHNTTAEMRIWTWPAANAAPTAVNRAVTAWSNAGRVCPGPDNRDWCGFIDFRMMGAFLADGVAGWLWTPAQTGAGGFPFPYTQIARFDTTNNLALVDEPQIWAADRAFVYGSAAVNNNGDVGGAIMWGGGAFFPSCSVWLADDENGDTFSPLEHEPVIEGTTGPGSNRSGDYLSVRTYHPNDAAYVSACFAYEVTTRGTARYTLFGRQSSFSTVFGDGFEIGNTSNWDNQVVD
ncbi:MAG: hypothetical protein AAGN66_12595 [Acidobacteriota bacterium]